LLLSLELDAAAVSPVEWRVGGEVWDGMVWQGTGVGRRLSLVPVETFQQIGCKMWADASKHSGRTVEVLGCGCGHSVQPAARIAQREGGGGLAQQSVRRPYRMSFSYMSCVKFSFWGAHPAACVNALVHGYPWRRRPPGRGRARGWSPRGLPRDIEVVTVRPLGRREKTRAHRTMSASSVLAFASRRALF